MRNTLLTIAIVLAMIIDTHLLFNTANARTSTTNYSMRPYATAPYRSGTRLYRPARVGEPYSAKRVKRNYQNTGCHQYNGCGTWYRASSCSPVYNGCRTYNNGCYTYSNSCNYQRCQPIRNTVRFFRCRQPVRTFFRNGGFFRRGCW